MFGVGFDGRENMSRTPSVNSSIECERCSENDSHIPFKQPPKHRKPESSSCPSSFGLHDNDILDPMLPLDTNVMVEVEDSPDNFP